jgi:hypothetical protein
MELEFFVESGILHWVIFLSRRPFTKLLFQVSKCQFLHKFFLNCVSQSSPVSTFTMVCVFFFFWFEIMAYTLSYSTRFFICVCDGIFWDRVSRTIFLGWLWNMILLISASLVARITGTSYQCLAPCFVLFPSQHESLLEYIMFSSLLT